MTKVLARLSQLQLTRSKSWADKYLLTAEQTDQLLSAAYLLRAMGDDLPGNESTDVAIEIAQESDGSIVVFPALPA